VKVDVRVIAASNRNLGEEVDQGYFRKDLYYRLKAITLTVPPLRKRPEDIAILADKFAKDCAIRNQIIFKGFSEGANEAMRNYRWPGNVRELKNFVESIVVLEKGGVIKTDTVYRYLNTVGEEMGSGNPLLPVKLDRSVDQAERELILQQLFLLRQEFAELKDTLVAGAPFAAVPDSIDPNLVSHMEIIPDEDAVEAGTAGSRQALNPEALGEVTAEQVERELIYRTLEKYNFNKRKTAQVLQMAERTLYRKIKEYDIVKPE